MSDFDHYFSDITVEDGPLIIPCPACGGRWLRAHHSRVYGKNTYIHQYHPDHPGEFFDYRERGNWVCPWTRRRLEGIPSHAVKHGR